MTKRHLGDPDLPTTPQSDDEVNHLWLGFETDTILCKYSFYDRITTFVTIYLL